MKNTETINHVMNSDKKDLPNSKKTNTSREAWNDAAHEVLNASARQLSVSMRYLFASLNRLKRVADPRFAYTATDGENIYYNPMKLVMRSGQGQVYINRTYIHMLMHCIFPAIRKSSGLSGDERRLWDIASDIHGEYIIDGMESPALMLPESDERERIYKYLTDKCGILSIENIYNILRGEPEATLAAWEELFYVDDHSPWPHASGENNDSWEKQRAALAGALPAYGNMKGENRLLKSLKATERSQVSYMDFLKKFMRLREEPKLDPDSFDYGYYNYGLSLYGDMPLIEELETREAPSLEDFIIVIDTSGSCAGDVVENFLLQTLNLINELRALSHSTRIHLIQCDREIQSDVLIPLDANVPQLISEMELKGFGGTDFRPPFKHARSLVTAGSRISGMIYFTDGYGLYPTAPPPWKTAFVFTKEPDFDDTDRCIPAAENKGDAALRPPAWTLTHVLG